MNCAVDPFCCETNFDEFCQAEAQVQCNGVAGTGCETGFACIDVAPADCTGLFGIDLGPGGCL